MSSEFFSVCFFCALIKTSFYIYRGRIWGFVKGFSAGFLCHADNADNADFRVVGFYRSAARHSERQRRIQPVILNRLGMHRMMKMKKGLRFRVLRLNVLGFKKVAN